MMGSGYDEKFDRLAKEKAKRDQGIHRKFNVERVDGSSEPGSKHESCHYFVLDIQHDPFAIPALKAYAKAARRDEFGALADDLDQIVSEVDLPTDPESDRIVDELFNKARSGEDDGDSPL